jgi:hypothetical protein
VPAAASRRPREIAVEIEEAGTGNVARQVQLSPVLGLAELPPAVDELVPQGYELRPGFSAAAADPTVPTSVNARTASVPRITMPIVRPRRRPVNAVRRG